ncbi:nuclear transport factor 2 family protein [Massilia consociata]|uniref:Nuclear transport factor 2 family protein n=1 Tax=Massilia consociata TaxID=760117 RepID=A0ABV6F9V0_9BURK
MKGLTSIAALIAAKFLAAQFLAAPPVAAQPVRAATPAVRPPTESAVAAGSETHAAFLALERQRASAILRRDIPALRALMDRHYYHVDSRGRARSKAELLSALERDDFRYRVYDIESAEVRLLDRGSAAVVTGTFRTQQASGEAKPFRGRYVRVWTHQPDGWKTTFNQSTEIRPAQAGCPCD